MANLAPLVGTWHNVKEIRQFSFQCGFCGDNVGATQGYLQTSNADAKSGVLNKLWPVILLCASCNRPNFFFDTDWRSQVPAPIYGRSVDFLPDDIAQIYNEARSCTQVGAYTSCILACRKLLMHLAVAHGAKPNLGFVEYVDFLATNGWTPPKSKGRVDSIRKKGNEANHEIVLMTANEAREILSFVEMLLRFMFEYADPPAVPATTSTS